MADLKTMQLQCLACKSWFNAPIQFGDSQSFDTAVLVGNQFRCPKCNAWVPCNKENMRWVRADGSGGFVGNDTTTT